MNGMVFGKRSNELNGHGLRVHATRIAHTFMKVGCQ